MKYIAIDHDATQEVKTNTERLYHWLDQDETRYTPLPADLQHALNTGAFDIFTCSNSGNTLLHVAAEAGNTDVIKLLLERGAEDSLTSDDTTALLMAAVAEKPETVQCMIDHGLEINPAFMFGGTLLHRRAESNKNEDRVFIKMLELGADPNVKDLGGGTPLHSCQLEEAVSNFYARALIQAGADPNARDNSGKTPLHNALHLHSLPDNPVAQELLENGANLHAKSSWLSVGQFTDPRTPLIQQAQPVFDAWHAGNLNPKDLTKETMMQMLSVWPLAAPQAAVPRFEQLETIFSDPRWKNEHAEHKLELIQQIPGLSSREQMFLMGGHARALMQRQNAGRGVER